MKTIGSLWLITALLALLASIPTQADGAHAPIGKAIDKVPLFDAHVHYKKPAWGPLPPKTVIELMDRNGVAMALVSSTPDEGTIRLWEYAPKRIVPELRPYFGKYGSSNWTSAPNMAAYIKKRLDKYPHRGIGEFHVRNLDTSDKPLLRQVVAMAKKRGIAIHIHSDLGPVEFLYSIDPAITVIWAHAGMTEPAGVVEKAMAKYPTLYADTSYRERDILTSNNTIAPDWRRVIERFSDRFMVGSDTWVNEQWVKYDELIALNRLWLSKFPRAIAEKIAYRNAEKLFGRKVSNNLLGKR